MMHRVPLTLAALITLLYHPTAGFTTRRRAHQFKGHKRYSNYNTVRINLASSNRSEDGQSSQESRRRTPTNPNNVLTSADPLVLRKQAETLRAEADALRIQLQESKEDAERKRIARVDAMIKDILVNITVDESTQMLNTEDQVARLIQDGRLSVDNINAMFDRICEQSNRQQSIGNCSPLITLLLDAACMVDCLEREDNPNKRWNHRVERDLRKKLFAMGWGIDIDEVSRERSARSITGEKDVF